MSYSYPFVVRCMFRSLFLELRWLGEMWIHRSCISFFLVAFLHRNYLSLLSLLHPIHVLVSHHWWHSRHFVGISSIPCLLSSSLLLCLSPLFSFQSHSLFLQPESLHLFSLQSLLLLSLLLQDGFTLVKSYLCNHLLQLLHSDCVSDLFSPVIPKLFHLLPSLLLISS